MDSQKSFRIPHFSIIYFVLLLIGLLYVFKSQSKLQYSGFIRWYYILGILAAFMIYSSSCFFMAQLNQQNPPQSEIVSLTSSNNYVDYDFPTGQKECLRVIMEYYGIYLKKYFSKTEIEKFNVTEILNKIGFKAEVVDGSRIFKLNIPVMLNLNGEWTIIYFEKDGLKLVKSNGRIANINKKFLKDKQLLLIKPLPAEFETNVQFYNDY